MIVAITLLGYIALNSISVAHVYTPYHELLIFGILLFLSFSILLKNCEDQLNLLFIVITCSGAFESITCLAQALNITGSNSSFFKVSGTWENPNVTAMFIAMAVPAAFALKQAEQGIFRKLLIVFLISGAFSLLLLKCRTAWTGLIVIGIIYAADHFKAIKRFQKFSLAKRILYFLVFGFAALAMGYFMYQTKKASADGRLLIWKTGIRMINARPITGFGYGLFDKNYNLAQVDYLQHNKTSPDMQANMTYIKMAYNEFLQHAIEGGLIGLGLILAFFLTLLSGLINREANSKENYYRKWAGMGVIAFLVMSLTNFTFQAIPVMSVFFVYAAILSIQTENKQVILVRSATLKNIIGAGIFVVGICLLIFVVPVIKANYLNKQAAGLIKQAKTAQAITILEPLSTRLGNYESYWRNYGDALLKAGHFAAAEAKYNRAKGLTSDPELYMRAAYCDEQLGHYKLAAKDYSLAVLIEPDRLLPKVALMKLYWKMNDTIRCINAAYGITNTPVKIPSQRAFRYKQSALMILSHFQNYNSNHPEDAIYTYNLLIQTNDK